MKAITLGGTAGIGKSIADNLENICTQVQRFDKRFRHQVNKKYK